MEDKISIRPVNITDADKINVLTKQLGYDIEVEDTINNLRAVESNTYENAFVAIYNKQVIGWIQLSFMTRLESGTFCEVTGLVVDQNHRRLGAGKILIDSAIKWSADKQAAKLRVRCNIIRKDSHIFYEHMGFKLIKQQKVFELAV